MRLSLIYNSFCEVEKQMFFDELDFDHEDRKFEPYEFFGESNSIPLAKYVFLPFTDSPGSNETIHNIPHPKMVVKSNSPLLTFGVDDANGEFELPKKSRFYALQPCLNQEEDIVPQYFDRPTHVENIVDNITELTKLHHTLDVDDMPSYNNLEEDIVREGTRICC